MPLVAAGLLLAVLGKERRSLLVIGLAALVKPFAAWMLLPGLWGQSWKRWAALIALAVIAYLPLSGAGWGMLRPLPVLAPKRATTPCSNPWYAMPTACLCPSMSSVRLTVLTLVSLLVGTSIYLLRQFARAGQLRDPRLAASLATMLLLCLPTLHIWYLLLALPLAPFIRSWGLWLWLALAPAYWLHGVAIQANGGEWTEDPVVRTLMHLPPCWC